MSDKIFVGLHNHSISSLADAVSRPEDMVKRAKELGLNALALTDHGTLASYVAFKNACQKYSIKPIFGIECYFTEDATLIFKVNEEIDNLKIKIKELQKAPEKDLSVIKSFKDKEEALKDGRNKLRKYNHLILLAKNWPGCLEIIKIHNAAVLDGFYYKPRIDYSVLERYVTPGNIVATSACLGGTINRMLATDNFNGAKDVALRFQKIFGVGNFYLELQLNEIKLQKTINIELIRLALQTDIPLVVTTDSHFVEQGGEKTRAFLKRGYKTDDEDASDNASDLKDLYIKNEDMLLVSWREYMSDIPISILVEAIQNTRLIADSIENFKFDSSLKFPDFDTGELSQENYLTKKAIEGLKNKHLEHNEVYLERLERELKTVNNMGFASYFNTVTDIVDFGKKNQAVGPARGCLDGEALIPTVQHNFKKLKDIQIGDMVYDHAGMPRAVLETFQYPTNGEDCLVIKGPFFNELALTKDHLVWAKKQNDSVFQWIKAEDLKSKDFVFISKPVSESHGIFMQDLSKYGNDVSDKYVYSTKNSKLQKCLRKIPLNKEFYYFLGRIASCCFPVNNGLEISIPFFSVEKQHLDNFVTFLKSLEIEDFEIKHLDILQANLSMYSLTLTNITLINWFKEIFKIHHGYTAIPDLVMHAPTEDFIWSYLDGLSYNDKIALQDWSNLIDGPFSLTIHNKSQLEDFQRLFIQLGRPLEIQKIAFYNDDDFGYKLAFIRKPEIINKDYCYELHATGYAVQIQTIETKQLQTVYDIHVETSNSYLANFYVHNSVGGSLLAYTLGITDLDPIKFELQFERFLSSDKIVSPTFGLASLENLDIDYDRLLQHLDEHSNCTCHSHQH